jgi:hypothetical protein
LNKTFGTIGDELLARIDETEPELLAISDIDAAKKTSPTAWSKKEIIAHLVDSATNNHQRFVRGTEFKGGKYPSYSQDYLVGLQKPNTFPWTGLVTLWASYNRYLAHILKQMPQAAADYVCTIGDNPPWTLLFIADDYVEHLKHHLNQALGQRYKTTYGTH